MQCFPEVCYAGRITFKPYTRFFRYPIFFAQGIWKERTGWLLKFENEKGQIGYGDVATLPVFWGTESLDTLRQIIPQTPNTPVELDRVLQQIDHLPALQSALSMAAIQLSGALDNGLASALPVVGFLSLNKQAIDQLQQQQALGYQTFKVKIALKSIAQEQSMLKQLCEHLLPGHRLRLDANQGLSLSETLQWFDFLADQPIEFLEEPCVLDDFKSLIALAQDSPIPIALDEQVGTLKQLEHVLHLGWTGVCVIKPSALGNWQQFRSLQQQGHMNCVYSTAFETAIGAYALAYLAAQDTQPRAIGLGAIHALQPDALSFDCPPILNQGFSLTPEQYEQYWNAL